MAKPIIGVTAWRQTVNLHQADMDLFLLDAAYSEKVRRAGGIPMLIPHVDPADAEPALRAVDGLILSGGDDVDPSSYGAVDEGVSIASEPRVDASEIALVKAAVACGIPVLGICRGAQIINVAFGGTLYQHMLSDDETEVHGRRPSALGEILAVRHDVEIAEGSVLAGALGAASRRINSTHHQAIRDVAPGLRAVARAPDGTVEAVESATSANVLGVQWHPEKLPGDDNLELFDWIVSAASRAKAQ